MSLAAVAGLSMSALGAPILAAAGSAVENAGVVRARVVSNVAVLPFVPFVRALAGLLIGLLLITAGCGPPS